MSNNKILIVDGDGYFLQMYEKLLNAIDYEVISAGDGDRGLFLVKDKKPDLVLSEVKLERRSGLELLKEIKANVEISETPLIFLTSSANRQDIKEALTLGASNYLIKSQHSPTEVVDVIIQTLKKK